MKVKITYNLSEDALEFKRASKSLELTSALWDIEQYLRGVEKYDKEDDIIKIRQTFYEILTYYDINIDNLIE